CCSCGRRFFSVAHRMAEPTLALDQSDVVVTLDTSDGPVPLAQLVGIPGRSVGRNLRSAMDPEVLAQQEGQPQPFQAAQLFGTGLAVELHVKPSQWVEPVLPAM